MPSKKNLLVILICFNILIKPVSQSTQSNSIYKEIKECAKIFGLSIGSAIVYGIVNDLITTRICSEYFTEGFHKEMVQNMSDNNPLKEILLTTKSPIILAFIWGTIVTWWMGAGLGVPVCLTARLGNEQSRLTYKDLKKPLSIGLPSILFINLFSGLIENKILKNLDINFLKGQYSGYIDGVPDDKLINWVTNLHIHNSAYTNGPILALSICMHNIFKRIYLI